MLFAPNQDFHIRDPLPLSLLFICNLHWCKHCTGLEIAPILQKFPPTALCKTASDAVICRPLHVGTLFAPSMDFHIWAPYPLSFLFICTLHWCNHCTGLEVAPILRELPSTTPHRTEEDAVVYRPVHFRAILVPSQEFHIQAPHPLSIFFICTLHRCKQCTGLEVAPILRKFPPTALR